MRTSHTIGSLVLFSVALALAAGGLMSALMALDLNLRLIVAARLESSLVWWVCAGGLILSAVLSIFLVWRSYRGIYLEVGSSKVHHKVLLKELSRLWQERFPEWSLPTDVYLTRGRKWNIALEVPSFSESDLAKAEREIAVLLRDRFGFSGSFTLSIRVLPGSPPHRAL